MGKKVAMEGGSARGVMARPSRAVCKSRLETVVIRRGEARLEERGFQRISRWTTIWAPAVPLTVSTGSSDETRIWF